MKYWQCRNRKINIDKMLIMAILNITPDSFYDGGKHYNNFDKIKKRTEEIINEKADIIDIGGESTRPGSKKISANEEIDRIIPVVEWLKKNYDIPVSIDTYKSEVAEVCLKAGCEIINDISGLRFDVKMAQIISKYNAGVVIMHIQGTPETMQLNPHYNNVINEIYDYFKKQIIYAKSNNIKEEQIVIDPGIGFGKNLQHNLTILNYLDKFTEFNLPILIGASNKSLIAHLFDLPINERLSATIAINIVSLFKGANIIRVHNVKENYYAIRMAEEILKTKR
ncbi:MAG TPA: dihydropteroate synthase [bacterium]|nr:dihydropteroate synthase [bacterium]HOL47447.1 dihydropteroate synthase [bacterium]HPQ19514.1 dihydropteroate synthase [bacterium]